MNVGAILKQLFALYPNTAVSEATVLVYLRLLQDIPPADLQLAVDQAASTNKYLPTVAEIREVYRNLQAPAKQTWIEAWEEVQRRMRYGADKVPFTSPATERAVKSLGWRMMCESENPDVVRAQFRDAFNAYQGKEDSQAKLLPHVREAIEEGRIAPKQLTVNELVKIAKEKVNHA